MTGKPKREDFETLEEYLEEREQNDRYLQLLDKRAKRDDRRAKRKLFYWLNKRWQVKAERLAEQDEEYRRLKAIDQEGRPKKSYTSDDMKAMHARYKRRHELVKEPRYFTFFRWKKTKRLNLQFAWHRFTFEKLHRRTDSPFWHYMHNDLWICPDCDSFKECPDPDPDHLCTGQVVDIDELTAEGVDERDGTAWIDKLSCAHCGYRGKDAQRAERPKLQRRARR